MIQQVEQLPAEEEDDGDNHPASLLNETTKGQETVSSATVHMVKAFIGLGILTLPAGFSSSGWFGGLLFFLICGSLIMYLSLKLMDVADKRESNARSITEFCIECLGQRCEFLVNCFLFAVQAGICVGYVIFFSTYFKESLCFFTDNDRTNPLCESRAPSIVLSLILVGPSIFIRNISKLKHWCLFANGLILVSLIVIFISCLLKINVSYITSDSVEVIKWTSLGKALGVFVYTFEGATLFFEIRSSMKDQREFKQVVSYTLGGSMIAYAAIGLTGYLAFGSRVQDVILFNFPMDNPIYVFIQIFYCIAILLSYPLQMFPIVSVMEANIIVGLKRKMTGCIADKEQDGCNNQQKSHTNNGRQDKHLLDENEESDKANQTIKQIPVNPEQSEITHDEIHMNQEILHKENNSNTNNISNTYYEEDEIDVELNTLDATMQKKFKVWSILLRLSCLLVVFLISTMFSRLTVFLNFIGSIAGTFFCFILPVMIYETNMPNLSENVILLHRAIMILGIVFGLVGIASTIDSIF